MSIYVPHEKSLSYLISMSHLIYGTDPIIFQFGNLVQMVLTMELT